MTLELIVQYILDLGAAVLLPVIMFILGMIFGVGWRKALGAGLMLGVAFAGMVAVLGFVVGSIAPAASAFVEKSGRELTNLGVGWPPVTAIVWAWPYAFLMFPVQIGINVIMLALGWTDTLNVDMWNVVSKVFVAVAVAYVTGSVPIAFVVAAIMVILELKQADISVRQMEELSGLKGVSCPHPMFFMMAPMVPISRLLDYIPGLKAIDLSPEEMREKLGTFGENHVVGFIVGIFLGILARYNVKDTLILAINTATGLTLFPMIARLFITALMPIADGAKDFMAARFPGRAFYVGLDWPFLAGLSSIWVAAIIMVPLSIFQAFVLPGNTTLPVAGVLNLPMAIVAAVVAKNNLLRATILAFLTEPLWLWAASYFAPGVTDLAIQVGVMPEGVIGITWESINNPLFSMVGAWFGNIFAKGELFPGVVAVPLYVALIVVYVRMMRRQEKEAAVRLGYEEAPAS